MPPFDLGSSFRVSFRVALKEIWSFTGFTLTCAMSDLTIIQMLASMKAILSGVRPSFIFLVDVLDLYLNK